jgi:hypothetical protein
MAKVNVVNKQVQMDLLDIIRFQLLTHCYINHINLSELDFECLTQLGILGESELTDFCTFMAQKRVETKLKSAKSGGDSPIRKVEASPQTIRNVLIKVEKDGLIQKTGKGRKKISINPELKIQTQGNVFLNYKFLHVEPQEA